eukprot:TRINITY_DN4241_c0_g1_i2.p1 TRINITY_DN4241_c0_g1~~TRINITY_DN4241_c0_g1_i2.p1  ORF type:complete len:229 (+),score=46.14 TRINITY_DN4241_c0_g1_i2:663-1349(+)
MASAREVFFGFAFIFMLALAIGDIYLVEKDGQKGLGPPTKGHIVQKPILKDTGQIGKALTTVSIIFQSAFIALVAVEFVIRMYLSAFGFPCSFMRREICCLEYKMQTFWKALKILSAISFPIVTVLAVLMVFLEVGMYNWKYLDLTRTAIMVGVPLLQLVLSSIAYKISLEEYNEQYPEELVMSDVETGTLQPIMEIPTSSSGSQNATSQVVSNAKDKQPIREGNASA